MRGEQEIAVAVGEGFVDERDRLALHGGPGDCIGEGRWEHGVQERGGVLRAFERGLEEGVVGAIGHGARDRSVAARGLATSPGTGSGRKNRRREVGSPGSTRGRHTRRGGRRRGRRRPRASFSTLTPTGLASSLRGSLSRRRRRRGSWRRAPGRPRARAGRGSPWRCGPGARG